MQPWNLPEMNLKEVSENSFEVVVLPTSSTEAHNLHLPYGTDFYQVEAVADRACKKAMEAGAKVVRLPGLPYGVESNLNKFKLSIHVPQSTLDLIVSDIIRSLESFGVRKLLILNGHGGNSFKGMVRDLYGQSEMFIAVTDWWDFAEDQLHEIFDQPGNHADEMETSSCLHLVPQLVHMDQADDGSVRPSRFEAFNKKWAWTTRPFDRLTTNSGHGNPHLSTAEKGEKFIGVVVERLAQFLVELSQEEMDESFPFVTDSENG